MCFSAKTTILVTRPKHQANSICEQLEQLGVTVILQPVIEIHAIKDWSEIHQMVEKINDFDWMIFVSENSVRFFCGKYPKLDFYGNIAATGPGTAELLGQFGIRQVTIPTEGFHAEGLVKCLSSEAEKGKRFLLVRGNRGRSYLPDKITELGGVVQQISVYENFDVQTPASWICEMFQNGKIDFVTVTSSAIAQSLIRMFGDVLGNAKLVSISPITSATIRQLGFEPFVEAQEATMQGIITAIIASTRQ